LDLVVRVTAAEIAVVLGTLAALALDRYRFPGKPFIRFAAVLPITLPGIVTGVGMLAYFSLIGWPLSNWTLVIGHATFCITLVLSNVAARLSQLPRQLDEASADLGATPWRTFWRVTFPLVRPAILAGAILAFTLSFDEIAVSFFLKGRDNTLPLLIWGRLLQGFTPEINAVATVIIGVSMIMVLLSNRLMRRAGAA
jgi:spermidine/putrescine transport system permease protein